MRHYFGPTLLGLGIAAVLASLMSGLAGNINALSTVWTHDLYRQYLRPGRSDAHYLTAGRLAAVAASVMSLLTAWICFRYNDLMDYLQLLFSLFNAPLFAIFLLGMFTTWVTPGAAFQGLLGGLTVAVAHLLAVRFGLLHYGSQMLADFYGAIYGWSGGMLVAMVVSCFTPAKPLGELKGITWNTQQGSRVRIPGPSWVLAALVLACCAVLNYLFR